MRVDFLPISGPLVLTPARMTDERGFFSEVFREDEFAEAVPERPRFVQDNHSHSRQKFTVRGLHFQLPPKAQGKLVRVAAGAVLDVALDIRRASPSYGRHVATILSAENGRQLWIPQGFAHGFCTLEPDTHVLYKVTDYYSGEHDRGLAWDDPALGIDWALGDAAPVVSAKDRANPLLADFNSPF